MAAAERGPQGKTQFRKGFPLSAPLHTFRANGKYAAGGKRPPEGTPYPSGSKPRCAAVCAATGGAMGFFMHT